MSLKTKLLELFKYEPDKDGAQTFNIKSALNDNWDRIEAWAQSVKTALAGLVPTSRKVNGKALTGDVTLTGDDIAMGADDAESLRTAMAKRPLAKETLTLAGDINAKSAFPYGKSLVFRTTNSDWGGNMPSDYAAYAKLRSSLSGSYDMWFGASDCRFWFARAGDDAIPARNIWYELARCVAPEVHDLPLADGWQIFGTSKNWYCKDQFNQVTVFFRLKSTGTNITEGVVMATLPEGYRPRSSVTMPGLITFDNYTRLPCHIDAGPSGALQLYVDGTTPSGRSVIELTCAGFHYPAK